SNESFLFLKILFSLTNRYQIFEEPEFFQVIFYDLSISFIDACFSPDSQNLLVIPTRFPNYIFMLNLPTNNSKAQRKFKFNVHSFQMNQESLNTTRQKLINFEPRKTVPLAIIGPATGIFGQPLKITHITCNYNPTMNTPPGCDYFHFVTWNDDGLGEYCL